MPPSRHSSSHHSSSHRSSHSSSRSHSSHSSSHHSYSVSSRSRSGSSYGSRFSRSYYSAPVVRTRINQPTGWTDSASSIRHYRRRNHDYDYYPLSWTAPDGRHFEEGYYDENGQYYRNLFVPGSNMMMVCEYCGNHMMYTCKEGELPVCTGCGAQFKVDVTDYQQDASYQRSYSSGSQRDPVRILIIVFAIFVGLRLFGWVSSMALSGLMRSGYFSAYDQNNTSNVGTQTASTTRSMDSVYVEEIGRTCYLDGEDWYDATSQCWFWYNDEVAPYQWQYWYEGISSDYGDYGWMEFDMDSQTWTIEKSDGVWVELPDSYDTSNLWHFTDEYINPF